eukprot:11769649-Ditylum_brightwellii.AAC.1
MATKSDIDMNVSIIFGRDNYVTTITRKDCHETAKDLGVLVNPMGNFCPEFERREEISIKMSQ